MSPEEIASLFTRADGAYAFARWGRPIVPVVFGVDDATLPVIKGAIEAVASLAGHETAETDPELGANLMLFFLADWAELLDVANLDALVPDLQALVARLLAAEASLYRGFRFDDTGAIQACFAFVRVAGTPAELPADEVALMQAVGAMLSWSEAGFGGQSPLARLPDSDVAVLRPEFAALIRAAYDPVMPVAANDAAHAHRLAARVAVAPG